MFYLERGCKMQERPTAAQLGETFAPLWKNRRTVVGHDRIVIWCITMIIHYRHMSTRWDRRMMENPNIERRLMILIGYALKQTDGSTSPDAFIKQFIVLLDQFELV